jgi:hypothetical protein
MQQTFCGRGKSIAGAALVALGIFIFHENLDQDATLLTGLLGNSSGKALGVLPTVILASWRVWQACAADQRRFLHGLLQHLLILSWPLLLVLVGTILSRDAFPENGNTPPKKDCRFVDLTGSRSTSR